MAAVDYCRPLRARRSTITTHTHPKQRVSRAEDGHDGRDGPRRDGLGTPCDAPRLTVLRASQQQECIHTSSSCKQICRNRASQPECSAVLVGVHPAATYPAAGSALLSLQSYSSTTALSPTRHEERRRVSTLRTSHSGRPLATTIERVCVVARHTDGYRCCCYYCTQLSTDLRCQQKFVRDGVRQRTVLTRHVLNGGDALVIELFLILARPCFLPSRLVASWGYIGLSVGKWRKWTRAQMLQTAKYIASVMHACS